MSISKTYRTAFAAVAAASLALAGCSSSEEDAEKTAEETTEEAEAEETEESESAEETEGETKAAEPGTATVQSWQGAVEVPVPPKRPVVTDNRAFQILEAWGVDLVAAPRKLMSPELAYRSNEDIADLGMHFEPNLEALVAAEPDVVLNGYRFASYFEDMKELVPDAVVVDISMDFAENGLAEEFKKQLDLLGTVFQKEDEAAALYADFEEARDRAKEAYDPEQSVMGLLTSGGKIAYAAPGTGRSVGPLFTALDLTPAYEQEGEDNTHGDEISVEAIAEANPDWIIVLDRDAAFPHEDGDGYQTAEELITNSEALQNVTAVEKGQIYVLPATFYVTEDIIEYTEVLNALADSFEG
ncbi:MAG: ABC transporter substrate-binding protein [Flaviflexus sp.]|nr:ABC transporter substrate-binding protein [Flaviflexus sp.]